MRRITKKSLVLVIGLLLTYIYCEYGIYFLSAYQCSWLELYASERAVRAFVLADIHMLGPRKGHWLDKWRREWQMHRAYQSILGVHKPDVVFILGDVFDEGEWTNEKEFKHYVDRFYKYFSVPESISLYIVVGNHDIGFHNNILKRNAERFSKMLKSPPVQFITIKESHFVLINSMALHGDSCHLCTEVQKSINNISETLLCYENSTNCKNQIEMMNYSRPILMQHFPLYRFSDSICTEPDSLPLPERNVRFRTKIDSISKEATDFLASKLKPRVVFGGHTHHGCLVHHQYEEQMVEFYEYSIPSFSWRNRLDPKYLLVTITPDSYGVNKCGLPSERTIIISAVIGILITILCSIKIKLRGRW